MAPSSNLESDIATATKTWEIGGLDVGTGTCELSCNSSSPTRSMLASYFVKGVEPLLGCWNGTVLPLNLDLACFPRRERFHMMMSDGGRVTKIPTRPITASIDNAIRVPVESSEEMYGELEL